MWTLSLDNLDYEPEDKQDSGVISRIDEDFKNNEEEEKEGVIKTLKPMNTMKKEEGKYFDNNTLKFHQNLKHYSLLIHLNTFIKWDWIYEKVEFSK